MSETPWYFSVATELRQAHKPCDETSAKADLEKGVPGFRGGKERVLVRGGKSYMVLDRRAEIPGKGSARKRNGVLVGLETKCCGAIQKEKNFSSYFLY